LFFGEFNASSPFWSDMQILASALVLFAFVCNGYADKVNPLTNIARLLTARNSEQAFQAQGVGARAAMSRRTVGAQMRVDRPNWFSAENVELCRKQAIEENIAEVRQRAINDSLLRKMCVIKGVDEQLEEAKLLVCLPINGIKQKEKMQLQRKFPDNYFVAVVKNRLMKKCMQKHGDMYDEEVYNMMTYPNIWVFLKEDQIREGIEAIESWYDEGGAPRKKNFPLSGAALEGNFVAGDKISDLKKLPTKQELIQKTAVLVKMIPTKLARAVNQAGPLQAERIARGIKEVTRKVATGVDKAKDKLPQ